tara:strand:+ start:122 stop:421 length:300 start_codon:yes stop_codon:yes gene_type:complete
MGDAKYLWILGFAVIGYYLYKGKYGPERRLQIASSSPQAIKGGMLMASSANTANVDVATSYGRDPCPAGFSLQPSAEHGAEHLVCRPSGLAQNKWAGNA